MATLILLQLSVFSFKDNDKHSHQPVLRYYYAGLLDGREQEEGLAARRGLFYTDPWTGEIQIKKSGEFFASLVRSGGVSEEDFKHYVAGQNYRQG